MVFLSALGVSVYPSKSSSSFVFLKTFLTLCWWRAPASAVTPVRTLSYLFMCPPLLPGCTSLRRGLFDLPPPLWLVFDYQWMMLSFSWCSGSSCVNCVCWWKLDGSWVFALGCKEEEVIEITLWASLSLKSPSWGVKSGEVCGWRMFYTMAVSFWDYLPNKAKSSFTLRIVLNMRLEGIL